MCPPNKNEEDGRPPPHKKNGECPSFWNFWRPSFAYPYTPVCEFVHQQKLEFFAHQCANSLCTIFAHQCANSLSTSKSWRILAFLPKKSPINKKSVRRVNKVDIVKESYYIFRLKGGYLYLVFHHSLRVLFLVIHLIWPSWGGYQIQAKVFHLKKQSFGILSKKIQAESERHVFFREDFRQNFKKG